jgi:AcrR family transcriptional regulator
LLLVYQEESTFCVPIVRIALFIHLYLTLTTGRAILSDMEKSQSTRERILKQGLDLMSQSGLGGVTLGILAEKVGMSKSGLFAHFKSKEEVQISLLEHTAAVGAIHIIAPAMNAPEGLPRLQALVDNWFGWAPRAGLPGGCPVVAGMFEYDDIESPVRDKILAMETEWRGLLMATVEQTVSHGHLSGAAVLEIARCRPAGGDSFPGFARTRVKSLAQQTNAKAEHKP